MKSAKVNHELTKAVISVMKDNYLRDIEEAVTLAVATGKFETNVQLIPKHRSSIVPHLEGLGYKVTFAFGGSATISWEAANDK